MTTSHTDQPKFWFSIVIFAAIDPVIWTAIAMAGAAGKNRHSLIPLFFHEWRFWLAVPGPDELSVAHLRK
jgi:hypothetical protein